MLKSLIAGTGIMAATGSAVAAMPPAETDSHATLDGAVSVIASHDIESGSEMLGTHFSSMQATPVYGSGGGRLGVVRTFVFAENGEIAAVIDPTDGPLRDLLELGEDELLVVPLSELRTTPLS